MQRCHATSQATPRPVRRVPHSDWTQETAERSPDVEEQQGLAENPHLRDKYY